MFSQPALVPGLAAAQPEGQALFPQQRVPSVPGPETRQTMVLKLHDNLLRTHEQYGSFIRKKEIDL